MDETELIDRDSLSGLVELCELSEGGRIKEGSVATNVGDFEIYRSGNAYTVVYGGTSFVFYWGMDLIGS